MADIGQGGLNRAVIAIEQAKADLADALEPRGAVRAPSGPRRPDPPTGRGYTARNPSGTSRRAGSPGAASRTCRRPNTVQLRVVTDQPWDVARGRPRHPDRRRAGVRGTARRARSAHRRRASRARRLRGAEGQALLDRARRWRRARRRPRPGGRHRRRRQARSRDRRAGRRRGRAPARRPDGPSAGRLAATAGRRGWATPPEVVAELVARGVVEGSYDPKSIYRDEVESAPPELDELILIAPGGDAAAARPPPARARRDHRRGREPGPDALQPRGQRRQPGGPRRRGARHRQAARPVDRRHRAGPGDRARAWACSWRSAGAATTRRG